MNPFERASSLATGYFAVWVILAAGAGVFAPGLFQPVLDHVNPLLGIIMFGMGMTLTLADFDRVLRTPRQVVVGVVAQYAVMSLLAYVIARALRLPPELAVGVILVGACPGGTASNVITYIARGDVALSVTLTSISTILAPILTPWLTYLLARQWAPVPIWDLFESILKIVIFPVVLGVAAHHYFPTTVRRSVRVLPLVSVAVIALIVAAVVGKNAGNIRTAGLVVFVAVILHNGLGLFLGWCIGALFRMPPAQRRALTVEVGMQNSGLAVALAVAHFSPAAAVAGALFSIWHNVTGPILANVWLRLDRRKKSQT